MIEVKDCGVQYAMHARTDRSIKAWFLRSLRRTRKAPFWALRHVTFDVRQGEVLGVIGRNGAGKSTLLLLLSGLLRPDEGAVATDGRVSTLLGLGAGFMPDLTGRDNLYLNASYLGMPKRKIDELFEPIVEFSGLGRFIDEPVKNYSSGMKARLGFSIAAHVDPDILIVDEVLGVGDREFRTKSWSRMHELMGMAKSIVVVTHNMDFVRTYCTRAVWLENGEVASIGAPDEVVQQYEHAAAKANLGHS